MEFSEAVRTAAYSALNGSITVGSNQVEIYDTYADPSEPLPYYVILGTQDEIQRTSKNRRPIDATLVIDVITVFDTPDGKKLSEDIAAQVDAVINPDNRADLDTSAQGWRVANTRRINSGSLEARRDEKYIFRRINTYGFIASKL